MKLNKLTSEEKIYLGGGCFWCIEAVFQTLPGVISVVSGYAGGEVKNPTYEQVCSGETGHAEVVEITFNPTIVSLEKILQVFFNAHDPTTLNRQGNDVGTQYRSIILCALQKQKDIVGEYVKKAQAHFSESIVTEVVMLDTFFKAEESHQNYFKNNPDKAYCQIVIAPKVQRAQEV